MINLEQQLSIAVKEARSRFPTPFQLFLIKLKFHYFAPRRKKLMKPIDNLRNVLLLTDGRDKGMKIVQYALKIALWGLVPKGNRKMNDVISQLSLARKLIRMLHWLEPLKTYQNLCKGCSLNGISDSEKTVARFIFSENRLAPLNAWFGIINDIADDIICLGKLKVLDDKWIKLATSVSDRFWFATIFIDIHEAIVSMSVLKVDICNL